MPDVARDEEREPFILMAIEDAREMVRSGEWKQVLVSCYDSIVAIVRLNIDNPKAKSLPDGTGDRDALIEVLRFSLPSVA